MFCRETAYGVSLLSPTLQVGVLLRQLIEFLQLSLFGATKIIDDTASKYT